MKNALFSHKLTDVYEELKYIEQTEGLSPGGKHELAVLSEMLFFRA